MEANVLHSQKEQFKKAFLEIKINVSSEDRDNCAKTVNKSRRTINEYVNGKVYDNSTAFKIITFLRGEIDKRSQILSKN